MNFSYPQQFRAEEVKKLIDDSSAKVVNRVENKETMKLMRCLYTSEEGNEYQKRLTSALREGR